MSECQPAREPKKCLKRAIGVIGFVATVAGVLVLACLAPDTLDNSKLIIHMLATTGASSAFIGSVLQAIAAREKSKNSFLAEGAARNDGRPQMDQNIHHFDYIHFDLVKRLWYVVGTGTAFAVG